MALKLNLKTNERLIISGAVVRNGGSKGVVLYVDNTVPILREKDILTEADADTPCRRLYFTIQLMYIDSRNLTEYHRTYWSIVREILDAAPSTKNLIEPISATLLTEDYYQALKLARKLIDYEEELVNYVKYNAEADQPIS